MGFGFLFSRFKMEDFPSNSRMPKAPEPEQEEPKRVLKVVEGDVIRRKKPLSKRVQEMFFGGDSRSVVEYVIQEVMLPAARDMIADAISQGVERMIFGETRSPGRRAASRPSAFGGGNNSVPYNRYSSSRPEPRQPLSRTSRARHEFDEIILPTRAAAEDVLDNMYNILSRYEAVSVKDLYELTGVEFHHTDEKWGWTDLRNSRVTRVSNGYMLDLPKTDAI